MIYPRYHWFVVVIKMYHLIETSKGSNDLSCHDVVLVKQGIHMFLFHFYQVYMISVLVYMYTVIAHVCDTWSNYRHGVRYGYARKVLDDDHRHIKPYFHRICVCKLLSNYFIDLVFSVVILSLLWDDEIIKNKYKLICGWHLE